MAVLTFAVFFGLAGLAAWTGTAFQPGEWYAGLNRAEFSLPGWAFGMVWAVMYAAIAVAGAIAWRRLGFGAAIILWFAALVLNAAWSYVFFGLQRIDWGLYDLIALLAVSLGFIGACWGRARPASVIFVPYAAWIGYMIALNARTWMLN